jgi:Peroxisomal biogenesis factor 11 (PEX11)
MLNTQEVLFYIEKIEGKDQAIRLAQYLGFLVQALLKNTKYVSLIRKTQKFTGNLSIVRKVLRFGVILKVLRAIYHTLSSRKGKFLKLTIEILSLVYYITDHFLYFFRIRFIEVKKGSKFMQITDVIRNLSWVIYLIFKIINYTIKIHKVQSKIQKLSASSYVNYRIDEANEQFLKLLQQSDTLVLGIIIHAMDIPVALYFLDPSKISAVLAGVLGSLSSLAHMTGIIINKR